jgi:hypothetical protein
MNILIFQGLNMIIHPKEIFFTKKRTYFTYIDLIIEVAVNLRVIKNGMKLLQKHHQSRIHIYIYTPLMNHFYPDVLEYSK